MMEKKRALELIALVTIVSVAVALPVLAGTGSYPLSVVDGNSMYPNLQNGDLVYYSAINNRHIPNGTIIVFVQGETGTSLLDGLVRPVVIHRVIGQVVQNDGTVCYETKGDNNEAKDPFLTRADHVLGAETQAVPKVGLLLLFLKSPQGLIATVGIISVGYLGLHEAKRSEEKKKDKLLGVLAKQVINGVLSSEQFKSMELVLKYSADLRNSQIELKDKNAVALLRWLKSGGLEKKWTLNMVACSHCSRIAIEISVDKESPLVICPHSHEIGFITNSKPEEGQYIPMAGAKSDLRTAA